ncbi:ABC transporter permease [Williamsia sterculiae]|uniref:Peptide/nickel transport system permease protein n=1 Tax=Williamsia sterculiae TaxID=1344003 RepID=A0A1N7HD52_9NOCA|nr:ABC transporter permease [Williamsia sterculiae]SIS22742.1 peptide/nickel transport system permease protein [Williamsia sterculiae]
MTATTRTRRRIPVTLVVGLVLIAVVVACGLLAPVLAGHDPLRQVPGENLLSPSGSHPLGTDELDRDVFARVLYGIRTTLTVLVIAIPIGAVVGTLLGLLAASGRIADTVTSRAFDVVFAFPAIILGITVTALRGPGIATVIIAIAITEIPLFGRVMRASALRVRTQPYVESARLAGASKVRIVRSHVLPNAVEPLIVQIALSLSLAVFVESAMSFIGVGVRPPRPSLGSTLAEAVYNWDVNPGYPLGPLVTIVALSLGFLLIAQGVGEVRRG